MRGDLPADPADLDRDVYEPGETTGEWLQRGKLRCCVAGVYRYEAEGVGEECVVVVQVSGNVGVGPRRCGLPDKRAPGAPENRGALDSPYGVRDDARREAEGSRDVFAQCFGRDWFRERSDAAVGRHVEPTRV